MQSSKVVLIGAGNLATQLAHALLENGHHIIQVYSRTEQSASALATQCSCTFTTALNEILPQANYYIYSVKDDALPELISAVNSDFGIHMHTAGSVDMSVFTQSKSNFGVFYPLQTFSKNKSVKFDNIPIFVEANSDANLRKITLFAGSLSSKVIPCDSKQRMSLHLAAVFSCNFTNYLYQVAAQILEENKLDFNLVLPLIEETTAKLKHLSPVEAQTGPAVRNDQLTMNKHVEALQDMPALASLYKLLSNNILKNK